MSMAYNPTRSSINQSNKKLGFAKRTKRWRIFKWTVKITFIPFLLDKLQYVERGHTILTWWGFCVLDIIKVERFSNSFSAVTEILPIRRTINQSINSFVFTGQVTWRGDRVGSSWGDQLTRPVRYHASLGS